MAEPRWRWYCPKCSKERAKDVELRPVGTDNEDWIVRCPARGCFYLFKTPADDRTNMPALPIGIERGMQPPHKRHMKQPLRQLRVNCEPCYDSKLSKMEGSDDVHQRDRAAQERRLKA